MAITSPHLAAREKDLGAFRLSGSLEEDTGGEEDEKEGGIRKNVRGGRAGMVQKTRGESKKKSKD